jgi:hypothetical protein
VLALALSPAGAQEAHDVGYAGGSLTAYAVNGYHTLGGDRFWGRYPVGGGTVYRWATDPSFLAKFARRAAADPPSAVWWEVLFADSEQQYHPTPEERRALADEVLAGLRSVVGDGVPIVASAMAPYVQPSTCLGLVWAPGWAAETVAGLVADGLVKPGPEMPALTNDQLQEPPSCHQNEAGQEAHGAALLDWFG